MTQPSTKHPQGALLHQDKHRIPVNLTIILSAVVAAFGVFEMLNGRGGLLLIVAGIGVGAYSWFSNPRQYYIFEDALVIAYGAPRTKVYYFDEISRVEMLTLPIHDRLRVWFTSGKRAVLIVRDPETFRDRLQAALDTYRAAHPEAQVGEANPPPGQS